MENFPRKMIWNNYIPTKVSKMEAPNCQSWRLQLSKMEASNMEASNCQEFGHQLSIFSSLLCSLILATFLLFLL